MTLTTFSAEEALSHGHFPGPPGSDRAWELVSEPDTSGNPVGGGSVSDTGDRAVYLVEGGTPLTETGRLGTPLFSERTPSGWQTKSIFAHREDAQGELWKTALTGRRDLSSIVAENRGGAGTGEFTVWRLTPSGEPEKLYGGESSSRQVDGFLAVSEDGSRTLISLHGPQDPAHPLPAGVAGLYDVDAVPPQMVSLLPDGTAPACGISSTQAIPAASRTAHWVSADGSLAFFSSAGNNCIGIQRLYVRDIPAETTSLISTPPLSGPECSSYFVKSIPGAAYFYTDSRLVAKDSAPASCNESGDVYRYALGDGSLECVTCVIPGADAGVTLGSINVENIEEQIGVAEDGSRVYFVSTGRLLPGAPKKGDGTYRLDTASGDLAYVGPVPIGYSASSELSSDGSVAIFRSADPRLNALDGQQNGGTPQFYRYDDRDRSLICVSCPADGSAPRGGAVGVGRMSADGNDIAFAAPTPLVNADQNTAGAGQDPSVGTDVYEWRGGRLLLVSDGLTNWPGSQFPRVQGISPSGRDLSFAEAAELTPDALDGYMRLYDARIGGGFEFPPPPKPCPLEVCQGTPKGAPEEQAPGTEYLQGAGNDTPSEGRCPKGRVRRRGRCVGRHTKHIRKPAHHKGAKRDRRAAR
jgi:hypothetical protein